MYYLQDYKPGMGGLGLQLEGDSDLVAAGIEVLAVDGGRQSEGYAWNKLTC